MQKRPITAGKAIPQRNAQNLAESCNVMVRKNKTSRKQNKMKRNYMKSTNTPEGNGELQI